MRYVRSGLLVTILVVAVGCAVGCSGDEGTAPHAGVSAQQGAAAALVFYEVDIEGRTAILELTPNDSVVGKGYREYMAMDDGLEEMPDLTERPTCMYRGQAAWADGGESTGPAWSALNTCKGFQGMVAIDGETWILAPGSQDDEVLLSRMSEGLGARASVATIRRSVGPSSTGSQGKVVGHAEALTVPPTKWMELVIVSDAARFEELGMGAPADALQIANLADAIFRNGSLTPSVAIVVVGNIVIPGGTDPWSVPATGEVDPNPLLTNFGNWAHPHLLPLGGDEYALLTQRDLLGSIIGLATLGGACTTSKNALVQSTLPQATVATTLAHELGHSLGMDHDNGECAGTYVMAPSVSAPPSTQWSPCSSTALATFLGLASSSCLNNAAVPSAGAKCGNGLVDPGEQCDCASSNCAGFDPCCNGSTCQLIGGAECSALDGCCNNCQIALPGTTCEAATACAPAATCSGTSSLCPEPVPLANGTACSVATFSDGRCFQGDCQSRSQQCAAIRSDATACAASQGTECDRLYCALPQDSFCSFFFENGEITEPRDGSSCGSGLQCHHGTCVPSVALPVCPHDLPLNACGGCSSLAGAPGSACNICGKFECASPSEVLCDVANPNLCAHWVASAFATCTATCAAEVQTRSVTCQDASGAVLPDSECALAGAKPATTHVCSSRTNCAVGETCASTGPGTFGCVDQNECTISNGGCDPRVTCTNTSGGRTCRALDACHPAYFCPAGSACPLQVAADGTSCSDQNACTQTDVCSAGVCVGGNAMVCPAAACQLPSSCSPITGVCGAPVPDPSCNQWVSSAWSTCTATCASGTQIRSVICQDSSGAVIPDSECAVAGAKPATVQACPGTPCAAGETCAPIAPGAFTCVDLNECAINNGACDARVTCTNTSGGRMCGALDACHPAYLCPAGTAPCPVKAAADGTSCSDHNACTQTDVCSAGVCVAGNATVCAGAGRCQLPGSCNSSTGVCSAPVPDPSCDHCHDGKKNSGETGKDCGGSQCLACKGDACAVNADCESGSCKLKNDKKGFECAN